MAMKWEDLSKLWLLFVILVYKIAIFVSAGSQGCNLNFTKYPYEQTGQCIAPDENPVFWADVESNRCCINALSFFSQSLALNAAREDKISIQQSEFEDCKALFYDTESIEIDSCGLDAFTEGKCMGLTVSKLRQVTNVSFDGLVEQCAQITGGVSFGESCKSCITRFISSSIALIEELHVEDSEKGSCNLALVVAVSSVFINDFIKVKNFYACLPALIRDEQQSYVKLKYPLVKTILTVLLAMNILVLIIVLVRCQQANKDIRVTRDLQGKRMSSWAGLYRFSKEEIENAINSFTPRVCLGVGSAGRVYKGILPSGQLIAVKHIKGSNIVDSFEAEAEGLSRIRHPNLVCLFGCCEEQGEQYLVYEYCSNGNLAQHLLRNDSSLPWIRRVKILRDATLALRFLHHYPDGCIVHRDIKLTNILLTEDMEPKLSDFGLAKMFGVEESKVFTEVKGTLGYMDPEYVINAKLTCSSDLYSFGVVILQVLSGRRVIELDVGARDGLVKMAKDVVGGSRTINEIADPRLKGEFDYEDFESILQIAVLCVAKSRGGRPSIEQLLHQIETAWENTKAKMGLERTSEIDSKISCISNSSGFLEV